MRYSRHCAALGCRGRGTQHGSKALAAKLTRASGKKLQQRVFAQAARPVEAAVGQHTVLPHLQQCKCLSSQVALQVRGGGAAAQQCWSSMLTHTRSQ